MSLTKHEKNLKISSPNKFDSQAEVILDELAAGVSLEELKRRFKLTRNDIIKATIYGITELHEEYITLLLRKRAKTK